MKTYVLYRKTKRLSEDFITEEGFQVLGSFTDKEKADQLIDATSYLFNCSKEDIEIKETEVNEVTKLITGMKCAIVHAKINGYETIVEKIGLGLTCNKEDHFDIKDDTIISTIIKNKYETKDQLLIRAQIETLNRLPNGKGEVPREAYIVNYIQNEYEPETFLGVFLSEEAAQECKKIMIQLNSEKYNDENIYIDCRQIGVLPDYPTEFEI